MHGKVDCKVPSQRKGWWEEEKGRLRWTPADPPGTASNQQLRSQQPCSLGPVTALDRCAQATGEQGLLAGRRIPSRGEGSPFLWKTYDRGLEAQGKSSPLSIKGSGLWHQFFTGMVGKVSCPHLEALREPGSVPMLGKEEPQVPDCTWHAALGVPSLPQLSQAILLVFIVEDSDNSTTSEGGSMASGRDQEPWSQAGLDSSPMATIRRFNTFLTRIQVTSLKLLMYQM